MELRDKIVSFLDGHYGEGVKRWRKALISWRKNEYRPGKMTRYLMTFSKTIEDRFYFRYIYNMNRVKKVDPAKKLDSLEFLPKDWTDADHYQNVVVKNAPFLTLEEVPVDWDEYHGFTVAQKKLAKEFMTADSFRSVVQLYNKAQDS